MLYDHIKYKNQFKEKIPITIVTKFFIDDHNENNIQSMMQHCIYNLQTVLNI